MAKSRMSLEYSGEMFWDLVKTAVISLFVVYLSHQIYLFLFDSDDTGAQALVQAPPPTIIAEAAQPAPLAPAPLEALPSGCGVPPPEAQPAGPTAGRVQAGCEVPPPEGGQMTGMQAELLSFLAESKRPAPSADSNLGVTSLDDLPETPALPVDGEKALKG